MNAQIESAHCRAAGVHEVSLLAYLDDIVIIAPTPVAAFAFQVVQEPLLEHCGLEVTPSKTQVRSPQQVSPPGALAQYWQPDGIVVLGGPVDAPSLSAAIQQDALRSRATPFCDLAGPFAHNFALEKLSSMRRSADLVIQLASRAPSEAPGLQIAFQLLLFCVAPKADHLLRLLPPAVMGATRSKS